VDFVLNVGLPLFVVFVMAVVGLALTPADSTNVRRYPKAMVLILAGQWAILPFAAGVVAPGLTLPPAFAMGLLIISAAPIATLSNYYSLLARANLAVSVTITAISSGL
jgi:bile acid:Na+ symporter, BASS family